MLLFLCAGRWSASCVSDSIYSSGVRQHIADTKLAFLFYSSRETLRPQGLTRNLALNAQH